MENTKSKKIRRKHIKCAVCGMGFNSEFDEEINTFSIYHPETHRNKTFECETLFYENLLYIYTFIHKAEYSIPMEIVIRNINWENAVYLKKDMINWCLSCGYLNIDSLKRLTVPPAIKDVWKEIFAIYNMNTPEAKAKAIEYLKAALRCYLEELEPVEPDELIEKDNQIKTLTEQIEELKTKARQKKRVGGMATADITGARSRDVRSNR